MATQKQTKRTEHNQQPQGQTMVRGSQEQATPSRRGGYALGPTMRAPRTIKGFSKITVPVEEQRSKRREIPIQTGSQGTSEKPH